MKAIALGLVLAATPPVRAAPPAVHAWDVPVQTRILTREVTFERAGAKLSGTLYYPEGARKLATVIALHGAQAPLRSEPLYRHLRQALPKLGMAVFLFDRRGSGKSTQGDAVPGDFDALAADGVAAFATLAKLPEVDPARLGFWGLSQGGWLTLQAAALEPRAAFAVAVSAPMAAADVQMNFAMANLLTVRGESQDTVRRAIAARTAVDDYTRGKLSRAQAVAAEAAIAGEPWYRSIYLKGNIDDPAWKKQIGADPMAELDKSRVPTLIVFGQGDPWVPVGPTLAALALTKARHPNVDLRVIDGADHAMMLGVDPKQQMDLAFAKAAAPDAPEYFAVLTAWLTGRGLTQPVR